MKKLGIGILILIALAIWAAVSIAMEIIEIAFGSVAIGILVVVGIVMYFKWKSD